MMDLPALVRSEFPEGASLELLMLGEELIISAPGAEGVLFIHPEYERWTIRSPEGHAHVDTPEEAAALAADILRDRARFATEYRGDTPSAAWIEVLQDGAFEPDYLEVRLCPFDSEDWLLWPGERWRVVRVARRYFPERGEIETVTTETSTERSATADEWFHGALDAGLGSPKPGLRWTVGSDQRLVFQAPVGWRRTARSSDIRFLEFLPAVEGLVFRSRHFFRELPDPAARPIEGAVGPNSISVAETSEGAWRKRTWTLMFSDRQLQMMAIFDLFNLPERTAEASPICLAIESALPEALFVPHEWNMERAESR